MSERERPGLPGEPLTSGDPVRAGRYTLVRRLGVGAMGRVFLGVLDEVPDGADDDLEGSDAGVEPSPRYVAVKILRPELAENPLFRRRFAHELQAACRVGGNRSASVLAGDPDAELPWIATEYVEGRSLQHTVDADGPMSSARVRVLAIEIAEALISIHDAGVVHRDLKPSNVLLSDEGVKVIDFGVARAVDFTLLTTTGQTPGTPAYMAPEQVEGGEVSAALDVFSLGSLLAFALSGRPMFGPGPPVAILHRVLYSEPELADVAEDDAGLRQLIAACLAKDPARRPTPARVIEICRSAPDDPAMGLLDTRQSVAVGEAAARWGHGDARYPTGRSLSVVAGVALVAAAVLAVALVDGGSGDGANAMPGTHATTAPRAGDVIPPGGQASQPSAKSGSAGLPGRSTPAAPGGSSRPGPTTGAGAAGGASGGGIGGGSAGGSPPASLASLGQVIGGPTASPDVSGPPTASGVSGTATTSVPPPTKVVYSALIGAGCPNSTEGGNFWPLNVTGSTGWDSSTGSLTGAGCDGQFRWHPVDPTGSGQDTFTWEFDTGLTSAACRAEVYIPNSTAYVDDTSVDYSINVDGTNADGQPTSGGRTLVTWFSDQQGHQGRWVLLGTFRFTGAVNGTVNLIMADARAGAAQYVVAGPARLQCA